MEQRRRDRQQLPGRRTSSTGRCCRRTNSRSTDNTSLLVRPTGDVSVPAQPDAIRSQLEHDQISSGFRLDPNWTPNGSPDKRTHSNNSFCRYTISNTLIQSEKLQQEKIPQTDKQAANRTILAGTHCT